MIPHHFGKFREKDGAWSSNLSSCLFRLDNGIYYPIDNENMATRGFVFTAYGTFHASYEPFVNAFQEREMQQNLVEQDDLKLSRGATCNKI